MIEVLNFSRERLEHQLLLLCARRHQSFEQNQSLLALLQRDMDWDYLQARLFRNGLVPLFLHHLQENSVLLPPLLYENLRANVVQGSLKRLSLLAELIELIQLLRSHGVSVLAYKGPALAQVAYGSIKLRDFCDLDLLIDPQHRLNVISLLEANGYEREISQKLPPPLQQKWDANLYEVTLFPQHGIGSIDLHWAVNAPSELLPIEFDRMWERRVPVEGFAAVEAPCREDLIVCLCVHSMKHMWRRMEWIASVLSLLQSGVGDPLNWDVIEEAANNMNNQRILYLGLRLALDLEKIGVLTEQKDKIESLVPERILLKMSKDTVVVGLSQRVWKNLFAEIKEDGFGLSWAELIFLLRAREGWRARLKYLYVTVKLSLLPSPEESLIPGNLGRSVFLLQIRRLSRIVWSRILRVSRTIIRTSS